MLFYEPIFLFVFLPVTFGLYCVTRPWVSVRLPVLLAASLIFYAWGEPAFVPVVIVSALLDYILARQIARGAGWATVVGVLANLGLLVGYKYLDFLLANLLPLLAPSKVAFIPKIALPIGVSFVVFEKITYLVDIARRRSPPAESFVQYLTYVLFFPKLLAGPIIKYHEIEAQFRTHPAPGEAMVLDGFRRFMLGLIKKVMLADVLGNAADAAFALPAGHVGFADAWWGVILFTLQIYLDFSAYSDMAIGLAGMFGFRLRENFNMPYISCSITEFWRRWHISLSTWIREYLYIPLGGNRVRPWRIYLNLWLCFLASGLWHGAAWTFVLWGAYNGLFLMLDRLFLLRVLDRMPRVLANAITLLIIMVGWTVFRAGSLAQLGEFLSAMMHPVLQGGIVAWNPDTVVALVVGIVISLGPRLPHVTRMMAGLMVSARSRFALELVAMLLFTVALSKAVADPFKPFLYFRF
jgi:alginate O-acetyltransferase complex protein AlgI